MNSRPHKGHKHQNEEKVYKRKVEECVDDIINFEELCKDCLNYDYDLREDDIALISRYVKKISHIMIEAIARANYKEQD